MGTCSLIQGKMTKMFKLHLMLFRGHVISAFVLLGFTLPFFITLALIMGVLK